MNKARKIGSGVLPANKVSRAATAVRRKRRSDLLIELLLLTMMAATVFVLYMPTLDYPFQFDDKPNILQNENLRLTKLGWDDLKKVMHSTSGRNRPIVMFSFALNYYCGRYNPFGYRLVNIIIHILSGLLLHVFIQFTLTLRSVEIDCTTASKDSHSPKNFVTDRLFLIPFITSAIWIFHPLATNSVTYIIQRMNSMATMFYMLALVCYIKARMIQALDGTKTRLLSVLWFSGCGISSLAAMASKEIAATLPVMIFIYEWFFFQDLDRRWLKTRMIWIILAFGLMAVMVATGLRFDVLLRYFNLYQQLEFTMPQRVMTEFRIVIYYLLLLFYPIPSKLNIDHDFSLSYSLINPFTTALSLASIVGLLLLSFRLAQNRRIVTFCILWYFGNLVIESSILPLDLIFEHRIYLSSMLVIFLFVLLAFQYVKSERILIPMMICCVLVLAFWTRERNQVWENQLSLWQDCTKKSPGKSRPYVNLGEVYAAEGNYTQAIAEYQKALAINPYSEYAHYNIGAAFYAQKELEKAIAHYRLALKSNPDLAEAHNNLGVALIDQKKVEEGIRHYQEALRLKPDHPEAPENLKKAQSGLKQINERINGIEAQLKAGHENPDLFYNLGYLYYRKGEFQSSDSFYRKALLLQPDFVKALNGLSILLAETHKEAEAITLLKKIVSLQPSDGGTYYNIACMYARLQKMDESIQWLQGALDNGYDNWELIKTDKDLAPIRTMDSYRKLITMKNQYPSIN